MLSTRLVTIIERHAEELTSLFIKQVKTHSRTPSFRQLADSEIHQPAHEVYKNLGAWLEGKARDQMERRYEELGRRRCELGIPVAELIYAVVLNKKTVLTYLRNNAWGGTPIEIFAEEELVNRIDQFYDDVMYYTAIGYQAAITKGKHTADGSSHA